MSSPTDADLLHVTMTKEAAETALEALTRGRSAIEELFDKEGIYLTDESMTVAWLHRKNAYEWLGWLDGRIRYALMQSDPRGPMPLEMRP